MSYDNLGMNQPETVMQRLRDTGTVCTYSHTLIDSSTCSLNQKEYQQSHHKKQNPVLHQFMCYAAKYSYIKYDPMTPYMDNDILLSLLHFA